MQFKKSIVLVRVSSWDTRIQNSHLLSEELFVIPQPCIFLFSFTNLFVVHFSPVYHKGNWKLQFVSFTSFISVHASILSQICLLCMEKNCYHSTLFHFCTCDFSYLCALYYFPLNPLNPHDITFEMAACGVPTNHSLFDLMMHFWNIKPSYLLLICT